jgi:hypothetical protein
VHSAPLGIAWTGPEPAWCSSEARMGRDKAMPEAEAPGQDSASTRGGDRQSGW